MPIIKSRDFDFQNAACIGFNREETLIYCISRHDGMQIIYRVSIFGESVHEIARIEKPSFSEPTYNEKNEEICWLERMPNGPPQFVPQPEPAEVCLLTFVTFDLINGALNRFYHLTYDTRKWCLMRRSEDTILAYPFDDDDESIIDLIIYSVSCLDPVKGTFELNPCLRLPFYSILYDELDEFQILTTGEDRIAVVDLRKVGHTLYYKLGHGWVMENTRAVDNNSTLLGSICTGLTIIDLITLNVADEDDFPNVAHLSFRIMTNAHDFWQPVFQGPIYSGIGLGVANSFCISQDGRTAAFLYCNNSVLSLAIRRSKPCNLQESCISVLWARCRRANPQLTDYDICERLDLSIVVDLDRYFGKKFSTN